jgi:uncharacterized coiled-coil DUF342 family protein
MKKIENTHKNSDDKKKADRYNRNLVKYENAKKKLSEEIRKIDYELNSLKGKCDVCLD